MPPIPIPAPPGPGGCSEPSPSSPSPTSVTLSAAFCPAGGSGGGGFVCRVSPPVARCRCVRSALRQMEQVFGREAAAASPPGETAGPSLGVGVSMGRGGMRGSHLGSPHPYKTPRAGDAGEGEGGTAPAARAVALSSVHAAFWGDFLSLLSGSEVGKRTDPCPRRIGVCTPQVAPCTAPLHPPAAPRAWGGSPDVG